VEAAFRLRKDRDGALKPYERSAILIRAAVLLGERQEAFARLIAQEGGKPLTDARIEAIRAVDGLRNAAEEIRNFAGREIPMGLTPASDGRWAFTTREPIGVVAAISAFNHPLNLIVHQVAPAIAVGCPVIVKPAVATPLSCLELVALLREAGIPEPWCQTLITEDNALSERLATDSRIAFLSFIGSARVGWYLRSKLAPGTRCALEHGGAAPVIIDRSAKLDQIIEPIVKGGISFISAEQAKQNVQQEVPGWNFAAVHAASVDRWNGELAKLNLTGETDSQRRQLYTAMYHIMLMPTDRSGENPGWQSSEPYYDDYYAIWDTYRSSSPLLTLISPDRQRDIIRSLVDIYRHTGYMPDARSGNDNGRTQGGSNANVVVADAYVKGLTGIDYQTAFAAMMKDTTVPPADAQKEGRGGLKDYNEKGYVTLADERSGSRTVEYAYDDFAISELACGLGKPKEAALYASRAHNFEHLWDRDMSILGFAGFLRPRNPDGSWAAPYLTVRGTWPDFMYEGDIWTYSLYAPQDMRRLIEMAGGNELFNRRMDFIFSSGHFDVTNEPGFLMPVLYNYSGRPDKSADIVHLLLEKAFTDSHAGIHGNDDSGAMSSWLIFQTLGIYPVSGQDVYLIGTPSIPDTSLTLGNGKKLRILAKNLDRSGLNRYIQSATLNGADLPNSWFRHAQIKDGATLVFTMGSAPSKWGTATPPPSMSDASHHACSVSSNN
jgi:Glycosyl hydrolase family 92/Aldehyde dehydrogenase family